jgi:hypothetical protein
VVGNELFLATGNTLDVTSWSDGEAVFRVPTELHWVNDKRNYFAPSDWKKLDQDDEDFGVQTLFRWISPPQTAAPRL